MAKYGILKKIVKMVRGFYNNFKCAVEDQGETCEWFAIKTGVKQGCNVSAFLFVIVMDWVMRRAVGSGENGIRWKFTSRLDDLDFADNIVLLSSTKQQIQGKTRRLDEGATWVGLKINKEKIKVMRINTRNQEQIMINGQDIEDVNEFMYLGAKVCKEGGGMKDLKNRLLKARGAINKLKKIWIANNILRRTKLRLYKTLARPVLLYVILFFLDPYLKTLNYCSYSKYECQPQNSINQVTLNIIKKKNLSSNSQGLLTEHFDSDNKKQRYDLNLFTNSELLLMLFQDEKSTLFT